jgi:hypothetical protein
VSLNGWRYRTSTSNHTKAGFQEALNADVKEKGVRNPILVWSLPEGLFLTFGGSRLKAAIAAGMETIPAIINDYTNTYNDYPEVTPENWSSFFTDPPREFLFEEHGADYHYNLERARRLNHDPAGFHWLNGDEPNFLKEEFPWLSEQEN